VRQSRETGGEVSLARNFGIAVVVDLILSISPVAIHSLAPRVEEGTMHALLVTADLEPGREEEGLEYLRAMLPELEQIPGLLSGYWLATTKDGESLAMVLFENEEAAQEMAQVGLPNAPQAPGAAFRGAEVREVVAQI
jgi:hypothetical protein